MKPSFTNCQLLVRGLLTASLSGVLLGAQAQPTVTNTSPVRNANAAPRPSNVVLTYSQAISSATAANVRVFSQQAGGRKALTSASASGNAVTLDPTQDFKPGETVFVTAPATVLSTGAAAVMPFVYQFTAQAGVGPGTFVAGASVTGLAPAWSVVAADLDGDGDLDFVTDNSNSNTVSVRFNNGSGTFSGATTVPVGSYPFHVAAADIDNDGDLDLLVANYLGNTVSVRFNNGSGTFSGTTDVPVSGNLTRVVAADLDGDGDLDMLTASDSGTVSIRFNNGSGTFSGTTNLSVGSSHSLTAADIDSDGDLDILITNTNNNTIEVRFNNGSGTFSGTSSVPVGTVPVEVVAADVDGDGDLDLLATNQNSNTVSVRLNNGTGTFSGTTDVPMGDFPTGNVAAADVDGDGDLDLLTPNYTGRTVSVRLNNGTGTFSGTTELAVSGAATYVVAADLDGDNDLDFLVANQGSSVVDVRLNQLAATAPTVVNFTPTSGATGTSVMITGTNFIGVTSVTFNGMVASGFVVNSATQITVPVPAGATTGPIAVTTPGGTGTSATSFTVTVPPVVPVVTSTSPTRNANAAPRPGNVVLTYSQAISSATAGTVRVFSGRAGGRKALTSASASGNTVTLDPAQDFKPGETVLVTAPATVLNTGGVAARPYVYQFTAQAGVGPGTFSGGSEVAMGIFPRSVVAADVNGDGNLDLLTANATSNTVSVRLNNGLGVFSGSQEVGVGTTPLSVATADIDGDGDLDLLAANSGANTVSVRLNNGSGTFGGGSEVAVGNTPYSIVAADVDGDGDLDFLAANDFGNTVSVRLNSGSGAFSGTQEVPVGNMAISLVAADVDGDGDLDFLTANNFGNTVSVRLNDGTGTFGGTQEVAVGASPVGVVAADVDGDGDLDLLTANQTPNTVSVRLNNGLGIFGSGSEVAVGLGPVKLTAADIDGDGDLDLLTANNLDNTASIRLNNGLGSFSGGSEVAMGTRTNSVTAADVDGDGDLDLLTANTTANTVSVRFNQLAAVAPTVVSFTPTSGAGSTSVIITGTNFTGATGVTFNGIAAPGFVVNSATQITVSVPAGATTGFIAVTTPGGTATSTTSFTVTVPLVVTSTSPARNATAAPRPSNVALTYNQAISAATAATVRVFSQQAGGRKAFTSASASGNTVTLDPAQDFRPGEVVSVTAPATVQSTGGAAAVPYVYQFTAQAGVGPGTFSGGSEVAVGNRPSDVAVADVDGDGDLDILAANYNTTPGPTPSTVSVRLNNGSGTFTGAQEVSVGSNPNNVVAADVDGDGDIDLLVANTFGRAVSVRLNNGLGVFTAPATGAEVIVAGVGESVQIVTVFDVDGDGDLDLLASHYNGTSNMVSVRLNNGNGSFTTPATGADINVSSGAAGFINIEGADVDGDGDIDLLAANAGNGTVNVRLNNGAGIFTAPATGAEVSVGTSPYGIAVGDVDGDGDVDVLTGNLGTSTSTVSVRLNNGAGVFTAPATGAEVSVGYYPTNIALGDVDGDGDLDLLTANEYGSSTNSTVSVRLNNGLGTFAGGQEVAVGLNTASVTTGDVDGDGDLDLLTANLDNNTVSVRLNQLAIAAPTVTISTTSANPTSIAPFLVTVTFSQPVTGFTASSITVSNGSVSSPLTVSGNAYSFNVTPVAAGAVTISVAAGVAQNAGGLGNTAATPLVITYQIINTNSVWTGATSTDWFTASNWTSGVPTAFHDAIIITSSFGRQPVISTGAALSKDLVINAGASLTMSGGTLDVRGDWANNSTFTATGGTVLLGAKTTANNIFGSTTTRFWNLTAQPNGFQISNSAGAAVQRVLTLTGNIATQGNPLTLLSSPTGGDALVVNSGGVVTGTATVQRAIDPSVNAGLGYRHYSAPVSNSTVADLATTASGGSFTPIVNPAYNTSATPNLVVPFPNLFGYDQSRVTLSNNYGGFDKGYFSPVALTDPLLVGRGYTVNIGASELVDFQGTLNNGDVPLSLSRNSGAGAADGGWHLLGNPYPAPLDYSLVAPADRLGLEAAIYVFSSTSPYAGRYRTYLNGIGGNPVLPVGQGFFVRVVSGQTSASLTFRNSQRLTSPNATTFQRTAETRPLVQLTLHNADGTLADDTYVYFQAGATAAVDTEYDGLKLPNPSGLNLSTEVGSSMLAINGLPPLGMDGLSVPLAVAVPALGTYTLHADQLLNLTGTAVYLRDKQLNTLTDLHQQPAYHFSLNTASTASRFELVFGPAQVLSTAAAQAAQVLVYPNPTRGQVTLELPAALIQRAATLTLIDALGHLVREQVLPAGQVTNILPLSGLATGMYSLRLQTEGGFIIKKLVVE